LSGAPGRPRLPAERHAGRSRGTARMKAAMPATAARSVKGAAMGATLWFADGIRLPLIFATGALIAFMLPLEGPYAIRLLTQVAIYALLGIGYQFVFGLAGAFSLAQ